MNESGDYVRLERVLGAGPFREIGQPRAVATSPSSGFIVVGGEPVQPQWHGHDVSERSRPHAGWNPVAVYRSDDLTCVHQITTLWPVNVIACHPTLPLAAIGTGQYDGGWFYGGELLMLDLTAGTAVSVLRESREVRQIVWRDAQTIDVVLAIECDEDEDEFGTTSLACSFSRAYWGGATKGTLKPPYRETPVPDGPETDPTVAATAAIEALCEERGVSWTRRRGVWAVESLPDGRILAALEDVTLECWSPDAAEPLWRLPAEGTGYQVRTSPDGRTAVALAQSPRRSRAADVITDPSVVTEVDLDAGAIRATRDATFPAVLMSRTDGWWALRDAEFVRGAATGDVVLYHPDGTRGARAELGQYDALNHFFAIRYAPDLLFLQGRPDRHWLDKWVVAVDAPEGTAHRLFPLAWDGTHLFGGRGAYLDDRSGPSLVHTGGAVGDESPLLGGRKAFVVRRAYPTGEPQWVFTADDRATDLDLDGDLVYVTFNSGELVVLRAADGTVHARQNLRVDGRPVIPLSLARLGPGRLAIGTQDGRVLVWG
ncbi:hypothetical protein Ais01nite_49920 [Asanoa ishikariensis]|uniref:hypothetical protein n=1 Tax=Asanoa ishikariensis TaxID=137265 RepID=UPI000B8A13DF|nr:hypothetical protein [Asanoa ishikariensis]GIF66957.1 hypothetical protein Ais01nite_49920 [Asanoa ishikariensis]